MLSTLRPDGRNPVLALLNHRGERLAGLRTAFQDQLWTVLTSRDLESSIEVLQGQQITAAIIAPLTLRPENLEWQELLHHLSPRAEVPWLVIPWEGAPPGAATALLRNRNALADWLPHSADAQFAAARLENLMHLGSVLAESRILARKLEDQLITDPKTGIFNNRHFENRLREEFERTTRRKSPLAHIWIDLDDFKTINDSTTYEFGDLVLQTVGDVLRRCLRNSDVAARFGGDEFQMLLPDTTLAEAIIVADRVRTAAARRPVESDDYRANLHMSFGIAEYTGDGILTPRELSERANKALHHAKQKGKDRIAFFDPRLERSVCQEDPDEVQASEKASKAQSGPTAS